MKILHFVTGGFSGATNFALELVEIHNTYSCMQNLLVLRQKKTTTPEKLEKLDEKGIDYQVITGASHLMSIMALKKICQDFQPDILVAHGFPEHLIGRWAGKLANVPYLIQVEHNSRERYTPFRLWQSRYLSRFTSRCIGVGEGVASVLSQQQLFAPIISIANGIDVKKFANHQVLLANRPKDIIMVGRFAKSKDHLTLIKSLFVLKQMGCTPSLTLVGGGSANHLSRLKKNIKKFDLSKQITFIEHSNQIEVLLSKHKIFVMSSHFEGLNLAVLEAMANGCLVVGSKAVGVMELIDDKQDGFLFDIGNEVLLADILQKLLNKPSSYQEIANKAREKVCDFYNKERVGLEYYNVFCEIMQ